MSINSKRRNYKHYLRKSHRYLGVFIGIQFVLWTAGGLYFGWTNLKEIHGDHLRNDHEHAFEFQQPLISPQGALDKLRAAGRTEPITSVRVMKLFDEPFYEIGYRTTDKEQFIVANAVTGEIRSPISEQEAEKIATQALAGLHRLPKAT